jgi:seryl-tRNA synthetase
MARSLRLIDFERASKVAGANFPLYKGVGALLERALINFMLDLHTQEQGYTELFPPLLASSKSMRGTGQLPKLKEAMYRCQTDDLFLTPTAEVPLTNIRAGEIIPTEQLPLNYTGYSACFRREAGASGQKTRGLVRLHQFNMVGIVRFVHPNTSAEELERLVADAEEVLKRLELEYRVMKLCRGQLSFAAHKSFALEAHAPGLGRWLEVSSLANFTDFQARRLNIRFRNQAGEVHFVHTLNGAALALPRTMAALLEQYQRKDGTVEVPGVLRPYMHGLERLNDRHL